MSLPIPYPRSYWVQTDRLLAGCYPGALQPAEAEAKMAGLAAAGITHVFTLMEADEKDHAGNDFHPYRERLAELVAAAGRTLVVQRCPIVDLSIPTVTGMRATLDAIDGALADPGHRAYVHCWGGRGRTGTVICCWLVRHRIVTPAEAVDYLQTLLSPNARLFGRTPETDEQRAFVQAWKAGQ